MSTGTPTVITEVLRSLLQSIFKINLQRGFTNSGRHFAASAYVFKVTPNICGSSVRYASGAQNFKVILTFWQNLHLWSTRKIWWHVTRLVIFISYPLY